MPGVFLLKGEEGEQGVEGVEGVESVESVEGIDPPSASVSLSAPKDELLDGMIARVDPIPDPVSQVGG
jgi:hypothetical protein